MGEHHMIRKSKALYDCLCRVPLIVSWPKSIPAGVKQDAFVCGEDILPTLMEMLRLPIPQGVQGMSFWPLIGGRGSYVPRQAIHGEIGTPEAPALLDEPLTTPRGALTPDFSPRYKIGDRGRCKSVRTREWKLVVYPGQPYGELYHLVQDPWELNNLYGTTSHKSIADQLRALLLDWTIASDDCIPLGGMEAFPGATRLPTRRRSRDSQARFPGRSAVGSDRRS
jgi:arylsulfatase A-like enzyme